MRPSIRSNTAFYPPLLPPQIGVTNTSVILRLKSASAYNKRTVSEPDKDNDDLLNLAKQLIPFLLSHNAEPDAVDLLSELNCISLLPEYVDENTWERVVAYVVACVPLLTQDDDRDYLICARTIYKKYGKLVEAMTLSIRLDNVDFIEEDFR